MNKPGLALTRDDAELIVEYFWGLQQGGDFTEFATCAAAEIVLRETGNQSLRSAVLATGMPSKIGLLRVHSHFANADFQVNTSSDWYGGT